jgi:carboxymethylenebutenolidase
MYHGNRTEEPDEAGRLMMALAVDTAAEDLRGAIQFLLEHGGATGDRVAVIGFCMGGQLALYAATVSPDRVAAVADFYGIHPRVKPDLSRLTAPVLGIFAEKDQFAAPDAARRLEQQIKAQGVDAEFHIYPGVDHAFFNDQSPDVYDPEAAQDAWQRTLRWFRTYLT